MKRHSAIIGTILAVILAGAVFARPAAAFSFPVLDVALGQSLGVDGAPNDGGLSAEFSPLWRVGERSHFGLTTFADDIGTGTLDLVDHSSGTDLGTVTEHHRMTYGLAWRADHDVLQRRRWAVGVSGLAGWWRIQDDVRGASAGAASAVGYAIGLDIRNAMTSRHEFGIATRWQALTSDRHSSFRRVDHYATAALEWRWTTDGRH